jgi:antitoxin (DNA-binding transcriptional repressor) of toxin-antitoxin stability system
MPTPIEVRDLPTRLEEAVTLAEAGDEVILTAGSIPRARIVPLAPKSAAGRRVANLHSGAIEVSPDFDEPLPDEFWVGQS